MTKKDAIRVILSDKAKYSTSLKYAIEYCKAALCMDEKSKAFSTQLLYILSNITHWRHPLAKQVRNTLRN